MRRLFQLFTGFGDYNPTKIWYWYAYTCIKINHNLFIQVLMTIEPQFMYDFI